MALSSLPLKIELKQPSAWIKKDCLCHVASSIRSLFNQRNRYQQQHDSLSLYKLALVWLV